MNVFDPTAGMNAFAQGAQIGGAIRNAQTNNKLAPMVAAGDYKGAAQYAGSRGDAQGAEYYNAQYKDALAQMSEADKAAAAKRAEDLARTAYGLKGVPYEQRRAALQQQMPLLQQMGVDSQVLSQFDPTDQALDGVLAQVTPLADLLKVQEPYTLAPGARRFGPGNQEVAANPVAEKPPEPFTLGTGQVRYNPDGTEVARGPAKTDSNGITIGADGTIQIGGPAGGFGTNNKGKDPALVRAPDGSPAVSPGEQQARMNKVTATNKTLEVSDKVVAEDIDRAVGLAGAWTTGFVGSKLEDLEGTPAHDLKMVLQSIKANIGFDKLQQMRDNSPTGGALGQVTELELGLLQSVYGALEQSQTKEQFVYNLKRLKDIKAQFAVLRAEAFAMDYPDVQTTKDFREEAVLEAQGSLPPDKMQRLQELRAKRDAGKLQ